MSSNPDNQPATPPGATAPTTETDAYARAHSKIVSWLRLLIDPEQCVELRCLRVHDGSGSTKSGWFFGHRESELDALAHAALQFSDFCQGVYYTINPLRDRWGIRHQLRGGKVTRMDTAKKGENASDADVLARRWVLVDVDPVRAAGHEKDSASDSEKAAAWEVVKRVQEHLVNCGPPGVLSDSGNGYHLLYRVDETLVPGGLDNLTVAKFLGALAKQFDTEHAKVDRSVWNLSRIVKLPGTRACKGEESEDRPWRRAKVLEVPKEWEKYMVDVGAN